MSLVRQSKCCFKMIYNQIKLVYLTLLYVTSILDLHTCKKGINIPANVFVQESTWA